MHVRNMRSTRGKNAKHKHILVFMSNPVGFQMGMGQTRATRGPQVSVHVSVSQGKRVTLFLTHSHTVDGRNPFRTTVQKPGNDDSAVNTNKQ